MAQIRLEDVSKVFKSGTGGPTWVGVKRTTGGIGAGDGFDDAEVSGEVRALDHLSLLVPDGTTTVVVGPSGCGKSTLLRVVAGLTDYEGTVAYDGRDMRGVSPGDRTIGMVFQSYALYPHFRGRGNLSFFFQVHHAPDAEAEERIRVTSEMMGIGFQALLRRKPGTLSGGQQQRLAIARALVRQPELFLFDEPLSNLDAKLRVQTRTEIKWLLHRFGITALYVTHDQTEAMALADTIAVMRAGRIEQEGNFWEILRDPANLFVAGFLGQPPMNLIGAEVSGGRLVMDQSHGFPIPAELASSLHIGQRITIGIRPEAALVGATNDTAPATGLTFVGTIDVVEPDFGRGQQTAYVSAGELTVSARAPLDMRLTQGYDVRVVLPVEALYYFDTDSEQRIGPAG